MPAGFIHVLHGLKSHYLHITIENKAKQASRLAGE